MSKLIEEIAQILDNAATRQKAIPQWDNGVIKSLDMAYAIQKQLIEHRIARGNSLMGIKMGFTSYAKMEQMGVSDMIWGLLTSDMYLEEGNALQLDSFIHPRAEPEICLKVGKDIDKEITIEEAQNKYIDGICGAIEVIDSRYKNFKFSLEDVIADNCSSAAYKLGKWFPVDTEIQDLKIALSFGDDEKASGSSSDILGNPWSSVVHASRLTSKYGYVIKKGQIILAGAATSASFIQKNSQVKTHIETLGEVEFSVI